MGGETGRGREPVSRKHFRYPARFKNQIRVYSVSNKVLSWSTQAVRWR